MKIINLKIDKSEILINLITTNNIIENEVENLVKEIGLNFLEFSILIYISKNETTQYRIAKRFNISIQRVHHITSKLLKKEYIYFNPKIENGKISKVLFLTKKTKEIEKIEKIINKITKKFKSTKISSKNLNKFNDLLELFLDKF